MKRCTSDMSRRSFAMMHLFFVSRRSTATSIYIYIYMCVCVSVYLSGNAFSLDEILLYLDRVIASFVIGQSRIEYARIYIYIG